MNDKAIKKTNDHLIDIYLQHAYSMQAVCVQHAGSVHSTIPPAPGPVKYTYYLVCTHF